MDHPSIPAIEWCFGAGGNHLGLRRVIPGLRLVALSEIEAYAAVNVAAKMEACVGGETVEQTFALEPAPNWTDCRSFPCELFTDRIALFIASYPCQGESHAGKRLGAKDPRWLWPAVRRGVKQMRPLRCFFENVEGHISKGLRTVCRDLEALGYRVACGIFSAEEVGANHRRKRIFIMADSQNFDRCLFLRPRQPRVGYAEFGGRGEELADAGRPESPRRVEVAEQRSTNWRESGLQLASSELAPCGVSVADAELLAKPRDDEALHGRRLPNGTGLENGGEKLAHARDQRLSRRSQQYLLERAPFERDSLPSFPPRPDALDEWQRVLEIDPSLEPALCRMADGMAHRVDRLRLTGNGVVPDTAALAYLTLDRELMS